MKHFCELDFCQELDSEDGNGNIPMTNTTRLDPDNFAEMGSGNSQVKYKVIFNDDGKVPSEQCCRKSNNFSKANIDWIEEMFEKLASQAFLKIRQNADIFINLLILMLVSDLPELTSTSIQWVKTALFLNVSEEEATVQFKQEIDHARKQWYRRLDNVFHIFQGNSKKRTQLKKQQKKQQDKEKVKQSEA